MGIPGLDSAENSNDEELSGTASCLRVLRQDFRTFFDAGTGLPNHKSFEPSSADKKRKPIRVSVFDEERTTCAEAVAIRRKVAVRSSRYVVYGFAVADAVAAGQAYDVNVRVVRDLKHLDTEVAELPGADGHCGIEGLEDEAASDADTARALRDDLASRCSEKYNEEPEPEAT